MLEETKKPRLKEARHLAIDLIRKSKIVQAPVSLRAVITYLKHERDLEVYLSTAFSNTLSGMLVTIESDCLDDRYDEIHVNQNHNWHRRRFTIAHEIGHMLMNTSCSSVEASLNDSRNAEIEANQFAAELLIPSTLLKKDFKRECTINKLAWDYIVSPEAMEWRVAGSKLLNKF